MHMLIWWQSYTLVFNRFMTSEQQVLQKATHRWLLHQTQPQVWSTSMEKLCPSCCCNPEDLHHFYSCPHPDCKAHLTELKQQLQSLYHQHDTDPLLYQLLWQGITLQTEPHDLPDPTTNYPDKYLLLFYHQNMIGWQQLLSGCITIQWIQWLTEWSPNTNGTIFYSKVIQHIWQFTLATWTTYNRHLHNPNNTYKTTQLQVSVCQIFQDASQHPTTAALIEQQDIETILAWPLKQLHNWAQWGYQHMHNHMKALATRAKLNTYDIRNFFQPKPKPSNTRTQDKDQLQSP